MCNCIDKLYKEIKKSDTKVKYSRIHLSNIVTLLDGVESEDKKTGQKVTIVRNHKKKDGAIVEKSENTFITHDFCPFCGVKYK